MMNHIVEYKKFNDPLYEILTPDQFRKFLEEHDRVDVSDNEFDIISKELLKVKVVSNIGKSPHIIVGRKVWHYDGGMSKLNKADRSILNIYKLADEWWVFIRAFNPMNMLEFGDRKYFLCDGIDGVKKFIDDHDWV